MRRILVAESSKTFEEVNREEEKKLVELAKKGDSVALEKLIQVHKPFLIKMLRFYKHKYPFISVEDLEQSILLGFIKGIKNFDLNKDNKLLTYAIYYIRKEVQDQYLFEASKVVNFTKLRKSYKDIGEALAKYFCEEELTDKDSQILSYVFPYSLSSKVSDGDEVTTFEDMVKDPRQLPDEIVEQRKFLQEIMRVIDRVLTDREKYIFLSRTLEGKSLQTIGNELGLSKERVRHIETKAKKKLQIALKDFWRIMQCQ